MSKKLKCIIKRPDEPYGHVTNISATLENLQKTVGGYIETVKLTQSDVIIVNSDTLVGTIIVIGTEGDEFADVKMDFKMWKSLVDKWEGR